MIIINSIQQLKDQLISFRKQKKIIGFVPTMGALHQGHISLIEHAMKECNLVVCSIFVNPTQFNDLTDLDKYPRTIEKDAQMLQKIGCDILFAPEVTEIYSQKELDLKQKKGEDNSWMGGKHVDFGMLDKVMEGAQRPGHFNGVAQVVSKLFRIVEPQKAYFGQKDFQQLAIIRSMVKQLDISVEIIACPIIREENGLAMSSRNERLTKEERKKAGLIYQTLSEVKKLKDNRSIAELKAFVEFQINNEPIMNLEYFEIADVNTLQSLSNIKDAENAIACIALKIGEVRLIDNILL